MFFHIFSRAGNATAKCVEKVCVSPEEESNGGSEHPEEYFEAAEDFFYISSDKLPWSQAQTECLTKKGHLAELGGKSIIPICKYNLYIHYYIGTRYQKNLKIG